MDINDLHLHFHISTDLGPVTAQLTRMENSMATEAEQITALTAKVDDVIADVRAALAILVAERADLSRSLMSMSMSTSLVAHQPAPSACSSTSSTQTKSPSAIRLTRLAVTPNAASAKHTAAMTRSTTSRAFTPTPPQS